MGHTRRRRHITWQLLPLGLTVIAWLSFSLPNNKQHYNDCYKMQLKGAVEAVSQRVYAANTRDSIIRKKYQKADPLSNWDISFNKKGFISKKKCYASGNELVFYYEYKYKRKIKLQERKMYDQQDYLLEHAKYMYDDLGLLAAESIYKGDHSLLVRYVHDYSIKQWIEKTSVHAPYPSIYNTSHYRFEYNKQGKLIAQNTYDESEKLYQIDSFWYDDNGYEKRHKILTIENGFSFDSYSKYDASGNLITYQDHSQDKPLISHTYRFDSIGNWTQKLCFENGKLVAIYERKIEYRD